MNVADEDLSDVTTEAMIQAVKREIAMRERVYPGRIAAGKMTHEGAQVEIRRVRAILKILLQREQAERLL